MARHENQIIEIFEGEWVTHQEAIDLAWEDSDYSFVTIYGATIEKIKTDDGIVVSIKGMIDAKEDKWYRIQ